MNSFTLVLQSHDKSVGEALQDSLSKLSSKNDIETNISTPLKLYGLIETEQVITASISFVAAVSVNLISSFLWDFITKHHEDIKRAELKEEKIQKKEICLVKRKVIVTKKEEIEEYIIPIELSNNE